MTWIAPETNTHQDHVIAHVIGATPLGHFIWDETAYLILDIGFIWNIYLDMEMGLVPSSVALNELDADDEKRSEFHSLVDQLLDTGNHESSPIEAVELFENGNEGKRLLLKCERGTLAVETSLRDRSTRILDEDELQA